jgi:plastocyanin
VSSASPAVGTQPQTGQTLKVVAPVNAAASGFEQKTLSATANVPITIDFSNQDSGVSHNIEIYAGTDASGNQVFAPSGNETVTGPGAATYKVGSLPAGSYYYQCFVHPATMNGTLSVK